MNILIRVPLKLSSLLLLLMFSIISVLLTAEILGLIFGLPTKLSDLLYKLLGDGLYPSGDDFWWSFHSIESHADMKSKFMMRTKSVQEIPRTSICSRPITPIHMISYSDKVTIGILDSSSSSFERHFFEYQKNQSMALLTPKT